jgi:protein-disulfide isomerase
MSRYFALAYRFSVLSKRASLALTLAAAALLFAPGAYAQFSVPPAGTQVHDSSALKPPAGANIAIVEFEDMECPDCARANPLLKAAVATYKIPWVRHDFLIPGHIWSPQAAVNARWFDTQSKALGDEYRDEVFANQPTIYNLDVLRQFTAKFASDHHVDLPFAIDPQGKLAAAVQADKDLGLRIGIQHTPTIWVVTANSKGAPFIEVVDRDKQLYQIIDQAKIDTPAVKPAAAAPVKKPIAKTAAKAPVKKPIKKPIKKPAAAPVKKPITTPAATAPATKPASN